MVIKITNFGARVEQILVPDCNGKFKLDGVEYTLAINDLSTPAGGATPEYPAWRQEGVALHRFRC